MMWVGKLSTVVGLKQDFKMVNEGVKQLSFGCELKVNIYNK
jgi:hypothetical protein